MGIKNSAIYFLLFFCSLFKGQVLYQYPDNQFPMKGGYSEIYQSIIDEAKKENIKPCEKQEALFMRFVVYPDGVLKYVKDSDEKAIENNKCIRENVLKTIKTIKNWTPATTENGDKVAAMFNLLVANELFDGKLSHTSHLIHPTYFEKDKEIGINGFRKHFANCFDNRNWKPTNGVYSFILNFDVNSQGVPDFFVIENQTNNDGFNKMVINCTSNTKKRYWKPAEYRGIPVKQRIRLPIKFNKE